MAEAKTKTPNYTESMVETMLSMYAELGNDGLEKIATALNRPVRSVRAKLVREGVYVPQDKPAKAAKDEGPTKKELLNELETLVSFPVEGFMGATKEAIVNVIRLAAAVQTAQAEVAQAESED